MSQKIKIRLYINQDLSRSPEIVPGEAQVHYLNNVLRLEDGAVLAAFDGINGEYSFGTHRKTARTLSAAGSVAFVRSGQKRQDRFYH